VSFPKDGEIVLMIKAEKKYQAMTILGPFHPTSSASLLENSRISRTGLEKLE